MEGEKYFHLFEGFDVSVLLGRNWKCRVGS